MFRGFVSAFKKRYPNFHYGYIIVIACFLIMTVAFGAQNTFGVFFKPMANEFNWSRAATSGPFALSLIVSGVVSFFSGRFSDRFGAWKIVAIGALISGAGYILMFDLNSLWQLYLYYGVMVAAGNGTLYVPIVAMIAHWFSRRRSFMSGIGISGIGFGIAIFPPIASALMQNHGWRFPLLVLGIAVIVLIVLLSLLLRREARSLSPPGSTAGVAARTAALKAGLTFNMALKTPQFWLIFVAWIFYGFFYQSAMVHLVPYATDINVSAVEAATILSIIGLVGTAGRIILGFVGDKLGNRPTVYASYAIMGLVFFGLAFIPQAGMLYAFAIVFGCLFGIGVLLVPMVSEYFGFIQLGVISGAIVFSNNLGGAIGPPVAGAVFDVTGGYRTDFILCGILGLAAGLIIYLVKPLRREE